MAKPTVFDRRPFPKLYETGIKLGIQPSTEPGFTIELQKALGSSTGTFARAAILNPTNVADALEYTDPLPDDNVTRAYRARCIRDGYTNGAYTRVVSAKPGPFIVTQRRDIGIQKELVIPFSAFLAVRALSTAISGFVTHDVTNGFIYNNKTNQGTPTDARSAIAPVILPPGAAINRLSVVRYFGSTKATSYEAALWRVTTAGLTTLADITSTASGWQTLSTSLSYTYSSNHSLAVGVTMNAAGTVTTGVAVKSLAIRYTSPLGIAQTL